MRHVCVCGGDDSRSQCGSQGRKLDQCLRFRLFLFFWGGGGVLLSKLSWFRTSHARRRRCHNRFNSHAPLDRYAV